ncbi:MAG: hypothetical protein AB1757_19290 [Acidobacteriota bacterium]
MLKKLSFLTIVLFLVACGQKPVDQTAKPQTAKDPKLVKFEENIAKTTPEGKDFIEKAKAMKPKVNDQISSKTLGELIEDYSKNKGDFNIKPIGWASEEKKTNKNWKLVFYYQDFSNQYLSAEWEYNPQTKELYPFEFTNAPQFWTGVGAESNTNAKPKK